MFPIFIPTGSGGGPPPSGRSVIALLISVPLYAFIIFAMFHFGGIDFGHLMDQWYGIPAMLTIMVGWFAAVVATAMAFDR